MASPDFKKQISRSKVSKPKYDVNESRFEPLNLMPDQSTKYKKVKTPNLDKTLKGQIEDFLLNKDRDS